jgi:methyltransferase (TIGR00027 family)
VASVADTAYSIAIVRAEEKTLFDDPYAKHFRSSDPDVIAATKRYLDLPLFKEGIRLRTRYIDDALRDALKAGINQVVIFGAGFDMRGMRMKEMTKKGVTTFEVDLPAQLERKKKILTEAGVELAKSIIHVPLDFTADGDWEAKLVEHGFKPGKGAVFIWEGVIGYIDDDMIEKSLRFMAKAGGPGTRVIFTAGADAFDPDTAEERTRRFGFSKCEELGLDDAWRYYLESEPPPYIEVSTVCVARV